MPNWKKVIVSGSDANLNEITSSGGIKSTDVSIDDWGSVSASLASLDASIYGDSDVTDHINSLNVHSGSHLGTANTDDLSEGSTNLYYTDTRVKTKLNADGVLSGSNTISGKTLGSNLDNLTVDNTTIQLNSGTTYNGGSAKTISAKTGTVANGNATLVTGDAVYDYVNPISSSIATDINSLETDISGLDNYGEWNLAGEADTTDVTSGKFVKFTGGASITGTGTEANPYVMTITPASSDTASYIDASSPSQGTITIGDNDVDLGLQVGDSPTFTDLTLTGNLTVEGTRTELQVTELNVEDKNITIASGAASSAAADGAGITIDGANESLTWNHANSRFQFSDDLHVDGLLNIGSVSNAGTDTDKFLVLDSNGNVDYRTGAQVLSDIGGVGSSNGITGEGSFGSIGYSGNGVDYYSLARFSGSTSNVTGSDEIEFFVNDSSLISGPVRKGITFGRSTGERTYFDETGFVVSQLNNTNGLPQDSVNVNLQENGSGDPIFVIQTGHSAGLTLGTGDSPRFFMSGSLANGNGGTRVGIGGFSGDSAPFEASLDNIQDTLHIKGGLKVEKPTTSGTSAGVNFATNVRITGSLFVSASNTFTNQGPAVFSGSIAVADGDQVQATTDTDKFLVLDGDQIKYRSGAQVRSDIGAASGGVTLQNVTDNGNSTTNVIQFPNFVLSTPTNNNGASDKILVLDGSNRSKIRTRDELKQDLDLDFIVTPIQLVVDTKAQASGYLSWFGVSDIQPNSNRGYTTWIAPQAGHIEKVIISPEQVNTTTGNIDLEMYSDGTKQGSTVTVAMGAAGTNKVFNFGSTNYSFTQNERISISFDKNGNTADLYNVMVVFRLSN